MSRINCTSWELNFLLVSHQLSCILGANATLKAMNHTASCGIRQSCLHFCNDHLATVVVGKFRDLHQPQNNDWYAPFTVKAQKHKAQRVGVQRAGEGVVYIAKPWTAWGSSAFFSYGPLHSNSLETPLALACPWSTFTQCHKARLRHHASSSPTAPLPPHILAHARTRIQIHTNTHSHTAGATRPPTLFGGAPKACHRLGTPQCLGASTSNWLMGAIKWRRRQGNKLTPLI
jgi:hypothetical protein